MQQVTADDFRAVCANERFPAERDFYAVLGRMMRALIEDAALGPEVQRALTAMPGRQRARGEYLLLMLTASMKPAPRRVWAAWQKTRGIFT